MGKRRRRRQKKKKRVSLRVEAAPADHTLPFTLNMRCLESFLLATK